MAETINQIERDLARERDALSRNVDELETKARELTDWRRYYRNHPGQLIGVAMAGGVVLGILAGGGSTSRRAGASSQRDRTSRPRSRVMSRLEQDWDHIADALLGVASAKLMECVGELVPGFNDNRRRDQS